MISGNKRYTVALVGINTECLTIASSLLASPHATVVRILNPAREDLYELTTIPELDIIVDASDDSDIASKLRRLPLNNTEILSSYGARLLLDTQLTKTADIMDRVIDSMQDMRAAVHLTRKKDETLKIVLSLALRALDADTGSIMLLDERKKNLRIEAAVGLPYEVVHTVTQKIGLGIAGMVAKTRKPILTQGRADSTRVSVTVKRNDIISSICSPILVGEELIGVLNVCSKRPQRIFTDKDTDDLRRYAQFTADIIKTSWQFEESTSATFSQSALSSIRDILNLQFRLEERLNLVLLKLANAFSAQSCDYYEYNEECRGFFAKGTSSFNPDLMRGKVIPFEHRLANEVIMRNTAATSACTDSFGRDQTWRIAQPVNCEGKLIGLLFITFTADKESIRDELRIVGKTADMLGKEIAKNREMQTAKMQAVRFSAISEFSFDIAETRNFPELIRKTLSNASLILDAETAVFRLYRKQARRLDIFDSLSLRRGFTLADIDALDFEVTNDTVAREQPLLVPNIENSPYSVFGQGFRSVMSAAFRCRGELIGTLSLYDKKAPDQNDAPVFDIHDREVFTNFAFQVNKALQRFFNAAKTKSGSAVAPALTQAMHSAHEQ